MSNRKYIGVDLGAWSSTKTRIVVLELNGENLRLVTIEREPTYSTEDPSIRNEELKDYLLDPSGEDNTVIAIDAPFAVPSLLGCVKSIEQYYPYEKNKEQESRTQNEQDRDKKIAIQNQYLYDNSARFVYERTCQRVLAPTATLVGALTSRMVHIIDNYSDKLGICKTPHLHAKENKISTIEVFPTATLYQIVKARENEEKFNKDHYLEDYSTEEVKSGKFTKIKSYKKDKKDSPGHFNNDNNRERMLDLIEPFIEISNKLKEEIKTDDDYDAIICALTAYWADKENGYLKPDKKENLDKFTNSFIYIPKREVIRPE